MFGLRSLYHRWLLARRPIADSLWYPALRRHRYARRLPEEDRQRLRNLTTLFLHSKAIDPAAGLELRDAMRVEIALRASVPILKLGLDWYRNWYGVVVYPGDFRVPTEYVDEAGVVHRLTRDLCGEALSQGPMVLSWTAIEEDVASPGLDLVAHECAHKLDLLDGEADGLPPAHGSAMATSWAKTFSAAFAALNAALERGEEPRLDPYAATDPAEFFSVVSETFFSAPWIVAEDFPDVYALLRAFYRQDPAAILGPEDAPT
jgi:Mlc titration factor MtfA (ptsG expression regulator)